MAAERDGSPGAGRDWIREPRRSREELEAEIERLRAELEQVRPRTQRAVAGRELRLEARAR